MESEEEDGTIERKNQTAFSALFYPVFFTGLSCLGDGLKDVPKERLI
jgi:hypothetical protein